MDGRLGVEVNQGEMYFTGHAGAIEHLKETGVYLERDHNGHPFNAFPFGDVITKWPPPSARSPLADSDVFKFADETLCIALASETTRWEKLIKNFMAGGWSLRFPLRFKGIDAPPPPPYWQVSRGAWGCMLSHRAAMQHALDAGLKSICIVESDCIIRPDFAPRLARFLANVPDDWDMLTLGGMDTTPQEYAAPHVVRVLGQVNWHCYIIRDRLIPAMLRHLQNSPTHCDVCVWPWLQSRRVYAPSGDYLAGQAMGFSNNTQMKSRERWWNRQRRYTPAIISGNVLNKIFC